MVKQNFLDEIRANVSYALNHLIEASNLRPGKIIVVGCSSSEIQGERIGSCTNSDIGEAVFRGLYPLIEKHRLNLAVQCCEHLNRCLVVENLCAEQYGLEPVNVVPHPKAGGALATVAYHNLKEPVIVEKISAHAGIDIGDTFIGMHLQPVAAPLRCEIKKIGAAHLTMAKTRFKLIGGERAKYI